MLWTECCSTSSAHAVIVWWLSGRGVTLGLLPSHQGEISVLEGSLLILCFHARDRRCDTQRESWRQLLILYACLGKCVADKCRLVAVSADSAPSAESTSCWTLQSCYTRAKICLLDCQIACTTAASWKTIKSWACRARAAPRAVGIQNRSLHTNEANCSQATSETAHDLCQVREHHGFP